MTATEDKEKKLSELRLRIDSTDKAIVAFLNERAKIVQEIGHLKKTQNQQESETLSHVFIPGREKLIMKRLETMNPGPLSNESLKNIYREILSASIQLQRPMIVSYLGPKGSFSHQAAMKRFGSSTTYVETHTISDLFLSVERGESTYAVVPYENSIQGVVGETADNLISSTLKIRAETFLPIQICFLSNSTPADITKVYSRKEAFNQCTTYLRKFYPGAELVNVASTSLAAFHASKEAGSAAIASALCSELYSIAIIDVNVQDCKVNNTRFLVLASEFDKPTNEDTTLVSTIVCSTQPSRLLHTLNTFKECGIEIAKTTHRPLEKDPWSTAIIWECRGHSSQPEFQEALRLLRHSNPSTHLIGSFPVELPTS